MAESLVLDPPEVSYSRAALDITEFVGEGGPDFGDAAIEQFLAEGYRGQIPVDFKVPNRVITIPLLLRDVTGRSFAQIREFVQAKVGLFQREGGWLKRQLADGVVYADVVNATLHYGGSFFQAMRDLDADAVLTLECLPDFYGDEIALGVHAETTLPELVFTETGIKGDLPGRVRLVVNEDQGVSQHGLMWGLRARHWSSDATARLAYRAEAMTPLDAATRGSSMVTHTTIGQSWTPVLSTDLAGSGALTHTGTYRVWAKIGSGFAGAEIQARFVWDVGDMTNPTTNRPWLFPVPPTGHYYTADLGEIRIDAPPGGVHKWVGQLEAKATTVGTSTFSVVDVWFQPVDDGCGRLSAINATSSTFTTYAARDNFDSAGSNAALTGRTMNVGGVWAGAGDADDDFRRTSSPVAPFHEYRSAVSDAEWTGRYAIAGTTSLAASAVRVTFLHQNPLVAAGSAVFLRYTDVNNWLMAQVTAWDAPLTQFEVFKRVGGTVHKIGGHDGAWPLATNSWYTLELVCDNDGAYNLNFGWQEPLWPFASGNDASLATGGVLATGRQGMYDVNTSATAQNRLYDDFSVYVPTQDAVLFANQSAELTFQGMYRQAITGGSYGPVSQVLGDLPRLPPSGLEQRPVEVFLKGSRGDLGHVPDLGIDNISARLFYRPSWLFVPESGLGPPTSTGLFPSIDLFTGLSDQQRQGQPPAPDLYPQF